MNNNTYPAEYKTKTILVTISITQSTTCEIEIEEPWNSEAIDRNRLETIVQSQIELPSTGVGNWNIDDLTVIEE